MGMSVGGGGEEVKSEPNVVPMIDVMLVLLIIFMIVTPIISAGFQAEMPEARNIQKAEEEESDVVLGVDQMGRYYLDPATGEIGPVAGADWETTQADVLSQVLTSIYAARADKIMFFRADKDLDYSYVEDAMDIARKAGVRVLSAVTEEDRSVLRGGR